MFIKTSSRHGNLGIIKAPGLGGIIGGDGYGGLNTCYAEWEAVTSHDIVHYHNLCHLDAIVQSCIMGDGALLPVVLRPFSGQLYLTFGPESFLKCDPCHLGTEQCGYVSFVDRRCLQLSAGEITGNLALLCHWAIKGVCFATPVCFSMRLWLMASSGLQQAPSASHCTGKGPWLCGPTYQWVKDCQGPFHWLKSSKCDFNLSLRWG